MEIAMLPVGIFQTNCYILSSKNGNAVVIDAGSSAEAIEKYCKSKNLQVKILAFTHGHFDHIGAASALKAAFDAATWVPADDLPLFLDPVQTQGDFFPSFSGYQPQQPDILYHEGDSIVLDEITLTILHTPGHSPGSSVFLCENLMFSGDTLFAGSVGRTDLYGGDAALLKQSVRRLADLERDYQILPGHGEATQLSQERITNPFMGGNYDDVF